MIQGRKDVFLIVIIHNDTIIIYFSNWHIFGNFFFFIRNEQLYKNRKERMTQYE